MYAYIKGTIISKLTDRLIVDNHGIGYAIQASAALIEQFPPLGELVTVWTYLYVREDTMALYGFPSPEEENLFELLLTVSGIGPKVASLLVGSLSPSRFALAVVTGDTKTLTGIRGIGKKGAERLILELKDKLKGSHLSAGAADQADAGSVLDITDHSPRMETISALMVLGYSSTEAAKAMAGVQAEGLSLEDMIRLALKQLVR